MRNTIGAALACALLLSGCSSRPREFTPMLAAPQSSQAFDQAAFDQAYSDCSQLLVAGKLDSEGRLASAGAGAAAMGTTAVVGTGTAVAVAGYSGLAVLSATVVLLPFALVGGAVGMAKAKRAKKEKAIKAAMTGCLRERGYVVTDWVRAKSKPRAAIRQTGWSDFVRELTFRVLLSVEGREDRAGTARFKSALLSQPPEGVASAFQLGDPSAERLHALIRKRAGTRPVFSGVEVKQFADLFEREAGGLGVPDELQAPDMVGSVAANSIPF